MGGRSFCAERVAELKRRISWPLERGGVRFFAATLTGVPFLSQLPDAS